MKHSYDTLAAMLDHGFDTLIDVRAPSEFAIDHVPGAINLPVLSDAERAEVGTIYKQVSPFAARKLGAALVSRNAARHLQGPLAEKPGDWRPLVYCWRGGQRSGSFATILAQIGWRVGLVEGGYQTWRRLVHQQLYDQPQLGRLVLLDGLTGTAKTDILHRVAARGGQVIDLEGLAHHRGSLLGGFAEEQPCQRGFETALSAVLARLDLTRPILVEAESNKIGDLHVPPALWEAMKSAPVITLSAPLDERARYLTRAYGDMVADPARLAARMAPLRALRGVEREAEWQALLQEGAFDALARALMEEHYDPAYRKSSAVRARRTMAQLTTERLDPEGQDAIATQILAQMQAL